MAGILTGKANIQGGYLYGTSFCDLIIGTTNICPNEENNRAEQIFSKHLDIKGVIHIKDSTNTTKLIINDTQFNIYDTVTAEIINLNSLTANCIITNELTINSSLQINSVVVATLGSNERFSISRATDVDTDYMCHINNPTNKSLLVSGDLNINGLLSINDDTLDTIINNKLNSQTIITLNLDSNNNAGLLIRTHQNNSKCNGLLWIDDTFKLVKNIDCANPVTNPTLHDLTLNNLTLNNIDSNSVTATSANIESMTNKIIYQSINTIDLNNCTSNTIDSNLNSITVFKNGSNSDTTFTLQNPTNIPINHATTHIIITDDSYVGNVIIKGSIILPDGTYNTCTKIKIKKKGQNITFLYVVDRWYVISGGGEYVE